MALTDTERAQAATDDTPPAIESRLGAWWVIAGLAVLLLVILGWKFMADPSISAPTRDPAWYTWRANVILQSNPVTVAQEWGPAGLFSGGYRITVPLAGALLQRVAGLDQYSFSAFLMIGVPVLTGLALGAGAFRSRRDPLAMLMTMIVSAALFLTTPYVGYLDNITVLFLLALTFPFLHAARTSWGARTALFLIAIAAAFTHPTTCVIFGVVLLAVFGFHFLTSRFSFGSALRSDGPMLMSVGFGMIAGLAMWVVGIWGKSASLADAALPPPYTKEFFAARLREWVMSLQPLIIGPLVIIAIVSTILMARRERRPAHTYDQASIWWLLPFLGTLTVLTATVVPYYRFMNASAAPMALAGLGSFVAIRWCLRLDGPKRIAGVLGVVVILGSIGWVLNDGLTNRWVSEKNQWANQGVRSSLAAVHEVVADAGPRPSILVMNYNDTDDETGTNTAYGWVKTFTNVFRTGIPGDMVKYHATYLGTAENFLAGERTTGASEGYNDASQKHFDEIQTRLSDYPEDPVVFLIGQYYKGLCNGATECSDDVEQERLQSALDYAIEVGPDTYVLQGDGLYTPPQDVVDRAEAAAVAEQTRLENHPGALANPLHTLRVLARAVLPRVPAGAHRGAVVRAAGRAQPRRLDPRDVDRADAALRHRRAGGVARSADDDEGLGRGRRGHRRRAGVPCRSLPAEPRARIVRRVLQQHVLRLLQPRVRHVGRRAVPGAGGTGRDPGCVRQVDRVRRREGVRRHGRPVGAVPAEGRAGALRPVHAREPVHRRGDRPVRAPADPQPVEHRHGRRGLDRRGGRHAAARQGDVRGQRRRDRRPDRRAAVHPGMHARGARGEVGGDPRRLVGQGPAPGQRALAGGRRAVPGGRHRVRVRRGGGVPVVDRRGRSAPAS